MDVTEDTTSAVIEFRDEGSIPLQIRPYTAALRAQKPVLVVDNGELLGLVLTESRCFFVKIRMYYVLFFLHCRVLELSSWLVDWLAT